jgi:precorrin-6B methylase 2
VAKSTERTSFTKDIQGRYLCNDLTEVNAWKSSGGRTFDVIVIGGGTFGAGIAEHIWFRQKQTGGGLRTLVLEAGLFTIPEHVQNTGIQGRAVQLKRERGRPSTPQQPRFIGLQTHTGQVLSRRIQWKAL